MRKLYTLFTLLTLWISSGAAQAQYTFTSANLNPYQQNFDALTGTVTMVADAIGEASHTVSIPEVFAQANLGTDTAPSSFNPASIGPNNGSVGTANYYHFGYADATGTDRSFGGVASFTTTGVGYVGIRLKNSSGVTIKNLEVQYAMEQWYNSGRQDQAQVVVSYKTSATAIKSLLGAVGTGTTDWRAVPELTVDAPSTTTALLDRDGNIASNRRVRQTTITGLNLADGQEIMIRWAYALSNATNGNGLSIDDIVVTPETNIFYSTTGGSLNQLASWGVNTDGSGTIHPTNFTSDNTIYYVRGTATGSRIDGVSAYPNADTWTVGGKNSKVIIGDPAGTATMLFIDNNDDINGKIDVAANATLQIKRPGYSFALGALSTTSTVDYVTTGTAVSIAPAQYGKLKVSNAADKPLAGNVLVTNSLIIGSKIVLGNYSLTLQRGTTVTGASATNYVVTNGTGAFRQSVPNSGVDVVYPVGTSTSSYTPVLLQQPNSTTARNEDVFGVRVIENMYTKYDANGVGTTAVANQNVKKTWLVDEEVIGNSDITMTLQWNSGDEVTGTSAFARSNAYISHYTNGAFDKAASGAATTGSVTNSYKLSRVGINSFSPFTVSSRSNNPLPVELVVFTAKRTGATVTTAWATASEKNNAYFTVERSLDAQRFSTVGTVQGAGSSQVRHEYSFVDKQAVATTAYYRLRQTDLDGTVAYSPVVAVEATTAITPGNWVVVPNPGSRHFEVVYPAGGTTLVSGDVYNALGARVTSLAPGTELQTGGFDLGTQPTGVYLVRLQTTQGPATVRVVKQ